MNKLAKIFTACALVCASLVGLTTPVHAATICDQKDVPEEVRAAAGCSGTTAEADLPTVIQNILDGIILVLGTVAVVIIIVGGVQYMTSSGDAAKLQRAKNTILYACIGLVICVLAFAIVNFTIAIINGQSSSAAQPASSYDDPQDCVNAGYIWSSRDDRCR